MHKRGPYSSPLQAQRQNDILEATRALITSEGEEAITIQRVAGLSRVSAKTIHNIFGSRDSLLLASASSSLNNFQFGDELTEIEAGIPRLFFFIERIMNRFEQETDYMARIISVVVRANPALEHAEHQIARIQSLALNQLKVAEARGELLDNVDLDALSKQIAAGQWGSAFLWLRGAMTLEQFVSATKINLCVTLSPFCQGGRKTWVEQKLDLYQSLSSKEKH